MLSAKAVSAARSFGSSIRVGHVGDVRLLLGPKLREHRLAVGARRGDRALHDLDPRDRPIAEEAVDARQKLATSRAAGAGPTRPRRRRRASPARTGSSSQRRGGQTSFSGRVTPSSVAPTSSGQAAMRPEVMPALRASTGSSSPATRSPTGRAPRRGRRAFRPGHAAPAVSVALARGRRAGLRAVRARSSCRRSGSASTR